MPILRLLDLQEVKQLYDTRMKADFPASELRPFHGIAALTESRQYFTLGYEQADTIHAYACIAKPETTAGALLDYYAVCAENRGTGIGGRFLKEMRHILVRQNISHLLIEVERVASAKTNDEERIRRRRIHFYEKNGCVMSHVTSRLFGVTFSIMYLPITPTRLDDTCIQKELDATYQMLTAPLIKAGEDYRTVAQVWTESPQQSVLHT